jgi:hypothetical protein
MRVSLIVLGTFLVLTACENDLEQAPPNVASSSSLEDYEGILNAAYYYQIGSVTPWAVMGDFRADNALMFEPPFTEFDEFDGDLTTMDDQFFGPFYTALYKSILSANNVIENSDDTEDAGEAKFLRALSYFKLVRAFGDVPVVLSASPSLTDESVLVRQDAAGIYENVIIPDLMDAIEALDNSGLSDGRATRIAAQALLGKVYVQRGDYASAEGPLAAVVSGAAEAGVSLQENYRDIFGAENDLNSEIIFATQITASIVDEYGFSEFWSWYGGLDTKSLEPLDEDLIDAFGGRDSEDLRFPVVIDTTTYTASAKYPQENGPDHDWIELRLADIILLYAETLNELGRSPAEVLDLLDPIRERAGLDPLSEDDLDSQEEVREAIHDERRLELAFEGQRWFDLVRTGTVEEEMGQSINSNYYLFPIPVSEILSSFGVITQNPGY